MTYERLEPRRMLAAGDFDLAFSTDGRVETNIGTGAAASQILVQPDGKVLVAGTSKIGTITRPVVIRYNANGTLDTTFGGGDGIFTLDTIGVNSVCNDMALRPDGKIIIAGNIHFGRYFVARLRTNGVLDANSGFGGTDGLQTANGSLSEMELQGGQIIIGNSSLITRLNSTGTVDTTFGSGGNRTIAPPATTGGFVLTDLDVRATGQIVATGFFRTTPAGETTVFDAVGVAQLTVNGQLDTSFDGDGYGEPITSLDDDPINGVSVIQADGKVITLANTTTDVTLYTRYAANGARERIFESFPHRFISNASRVVVQDIVQQPDRNLAVTGWGLTTVSGQPRMQAFVARLNPSGLRDNSFGVSGVKTFAFGGLNARATALASVGSSLFVGGMTGSTADPATDVPTAFGVAKFQSQTPAVTIDANGIITVNGSGSADIIELEEEDSLNFTHIELNGLRFTFHKPLVTGVHVFGNGGNDIIRDQGEFGRPATLNGGSGNDFFRVAEAQPPVVIGSDGDDTVELNDFSTVLSFDGGAGLDTFILNELTPSPFDLNNYPTVENALNGPAKVIGNHFNNHLSLAAGGEMQGGDGNDWLEANTLGPITVVGGLGNDYLDYSSATVALTLTEDGIANDGVVGAATGSIASDIERIRGGSAGDFISGSSRNNSLYGAGGNDILWGNSGDDALIGEGGNDSLEGHSGNDYVDGGSGNDRLAGGSGVDELRGWAGDDRLFARDGNIEVVDGGSGIDQAQIDANDNDTNIESFIP